MNTKPKECHICGCTEDRACMTDKGPCTWSFTTRAGPVCTGCVVELPPDPKRTKYPGDNLVIEKYCTECAHLITDLIGGIKSYACEKGKFDTDFDATRGSYQWFVWSGIKRPNKTVAKARRSCQEWKLHPRWQPSV